MSDAIAADLNVFITHDKELTRVFADAAGQEFGLRIMGPVDVVTHLDELVRAEAYRPATLLGTTFRRQLLGVGHDSALARFANARAGERSSGYQELVRSLTRARHDRVGIFDPDDELVAVYCAYPDGIELVVPIVRIADHPLSDTLARQLLFLLRQQAVTSTCDVIRLADQHMSDAVRSAALGEGFRVFEDGPRAFALDICDTADRVSHRAILAARGSGQAEPPLLRSGMLAVTAAELERTWWPTKIIDSQLESYLIPIQQRYSADLLGVPATMLARQDALGLSREHVYYRSPDGTTPHAPSRLLWYMSGTGRTTPLAAAVVACSHLEAVITGSPAELHSRFRHLGVWDERQIQQVAKKGLVQALVFTNTEVFRHLVTRERLRRLGGNRVPYGPLRISSDLFTAIYRTGKAEL